MDKDSKIKNASALSEKLAQTKLYYDFFQNIQVWDDLISQFLCYPQTFLGSGPRPKPIPKT